MLTGKGNEFIHIRFDGLYAALCEAAFMTGLERNADVVRMATYAPLFAHVEGWQWRPDLIWFDNLNVWKTCSYHVQALYGEFRGERVLPTVADGLYASSVMDGDKIYVKVVNVSELPQEISLRFASMGKGRNIRPVRKVSFHSVELLEDNIQSDHPMEPVRTSLSGAPLTANTFPLLVPPYSFEIYVFSVSAK